MKVDEYLKDNWSGVTIKTITRFGHDEDFLVCNGEIVGYPETDIDPQINNAIAGGIITLAQAKGEAMIQGRLL